MFLLFVLLSLGVMPSLNAQYFKEKEILDYRTVTKKVYDLGNNLRRYEYYSRPIHFFEDGEYIETQNEFVFNSKQNIYETKRNNYKVHILPNSTKDVNIKIEFRNKYALEVTLSSETNDLFYEFKTTNRNSIGINGKNLNVDIHSNSDELVIVHELDRNEKKVNYVFEVEKLQIKLIEGNYYLVDNNDLSIYDFNDFYLLDSIGNVCMGNEIVINEVAEKKYVVQMDLPNEWLENYNIVYPVQMVTTIGYTLNINDSDVKDKTIVKNTYEEYDTNYFTVSKQNYYAQAVNPTYLSEYNLYGIINLGFHEFDSEDVSIVEAKLHLTRSSSNINCKLPISLIDDSYTYENVNGMTPYDTSSISNLSVNNDKVVYNLKNAMISCLNNEQYSMLLEISPSFMSLGNTNIKYMSFDAANQSSENSPMFVVIAYVNELNYGCAPNFYYTDSDTVNCFGYALRQTNYWINIWNPVLNMYHVFDSCNIPEEDYENFCSYVELTIMMQQFFHVRRLSSGISLIRDNEYRIAFRMGCFRLSDSSFPDKPWNDFSPYDSFHFMIELSDGSWADKFGPMESKNYSLHETPETIDWLRSFYYTDYIISDFFDSETAYFAISSTKPQISFFW